MAVTRRAVLKTLMTATAGAVAAGGTYGFTYGRHTLEVTRAAVPVDGLPPALSGFRIGLLTDIHRSRWVSDDDVAEAVAALMGEHPDMIVLGGDYVTWRDRDFVRPAADAKQVGIDVGLESFATLSTGELVENPRWFETMQKRLRRAQRKLSRRKKYSQRWRQAAQYVVQIHRDIANQRRDFQHQWSREIVNANGFIAVEDLNINGLASGMLAKSVADVGWSSFLNMLSYKAESAGRQLVRVDPRGTSQRCPCGKPAPKRLSDRKHVCECGLQTTRGHASSLEILRLGLSLQAQTKPEVRVCVA